MSLKKCQKLVFDQMEAPVPEIMDDSVCHPARLSPPHFGIPDTESLAE
jgi:hypothetical protein